MLVETNECRLYFVLAYFILLKKKRKKW